MSGYLIFNFGLSAAIHAWHEVHMCITKCRTICSFANEWLVAFSAAVLGISIAVSQFSCFFLPTSPLFFHQSISMLGFCLPAIAVNVLLPCWCPFLNGKSHTSICLASIAIHARLQRRIKINEHGTCQPNITRWPPTKRAVTSSAYTQSKEYLKI